MKRNKRNKEYLQWGVVTYIIGILVLENNGFKWNYDSGYMILFLIMTLKRLHIG